MINIFPVSGENEKNEGLRVFIMRIAIAILALASVAGVFALAAILWPAADAIPAARHPFSAGLQEAASSPAGIQGIILNIQSAFYTRMISALHEGDNSISAMWGLVAFSFAYGIFHAAGPGHGKAVISGYLISDGRRSLRRGLCLALASSLLQALTAITIVIVLAVLLGATAAMISSTAQTLEQISFALISLVGILMLWRKSRNLAVSIAWRKTVQTEDNDAAQLVFKLAKPLTKPGRFRATPARSIIQPPIGSLSTCQESGCMHLLMPETADQLSGWREIIMVVLSAGLRPCAGALIVLTFAFSQGYPEAGIAAVCAMAFGTFITVGSLASLAVFAKRLAAGLVGINTQKGLWAIAILEILACAMIAIIGFTLAFGELPVIL